MWTINIVVFTLQSFTHFHILLDECFEVSVAIAYAPSLKDDDAYKKNQHKRYAYSQDYCNNKYSNVHSSLNSMTK